MPHASSWEVFILMISGELTGVASYSLCCEAHPPSPGRIPSIMQSPLLPLLPTPAPFHCLFSEFHHLRLLILLRPLLNMEITHFISLNQSYELNTVVFTILSWE